ncbi:MAG TPA: hypothetical protein VHV55_21305 [Pirellulales bacterium]|nr:hypothetical protein [Pirellulales bacterium]
MVYLDIMPESDRSIRVLVAIPARSNFENSLLPPCGVDSIVVLRYAFRPVENVWRRGSRILKWPLWSGRWTLVDRIDSAFCEPFRVVTRNNMYYFVTGSGQLYDVDTAPGKDRKMRLLWPTANTASIVEMIEDTDAGKSYAFTASSFFHIDSKITPQLCDIGPADEIKPDDPLPVLRRCAQTLVQRGLVKLPAAGEPQPAKAN